MSISSREAAWRRRPGLQRVSSVIGSHAVVRLDVIVPDEILPNLPCRPTDRPRASRLERHPERTGQFS